MTEDSNTCWLSLFLTEHLQEGQEEKQFLFYVVHAVKLGIGEFKVEGIFTNSSAAKRFCQAIDSSLHYVKGSSSVEALPLQTIIDMLIENRLGKLAEVVSRLNTRI